MFNQQLKILMDLLIFWFCNFGFTLSKVSPVICNSTSLEQMFEIDEYLL